MKIKALIGAAALSALALSGAAFAQDAGSSPAPAAAPSGPGTMQPIPNPPESAARHMKGHHHKMKGHHKAHHKGSRKAKAEASTASSATPPAK